MGISEQTFSCAGFKKISLRKQKSVNQTYFLPENKLKNIKHNLWRRLKINLRSWQPVALPLRMCQS